jgi:hypothetical protein
MIHRLFPGLVLTLFAAACGNAELPPIELDGPGGPRLMTGAGKTPEEAYDFAYAQIHPQHNRIKQSLDARYNNRLGAQAALERILEALQSMRSLVTPAFQSKFDPYLLKYRGWLRDVERDIWGGSFMTDLDQAEREVKSQFSISKVELVAEISPAKPAPQAAAPAPKPEPVPPAPGPNTAPPSDKVELPPGPKTPPPPPPVAPPPVAPPPAAPAMPFRLAYRAWDAAHDQLIGAYKAKKDCAAFYQDVTGALALMKPQVPAEKQGKLQIYIDYYSGVHEKTKGFTVLPDKTSEKDIVDELDVAARVIRKEFNPDK